MSKPHADIEECLFLIELKRDAARAAMQQIVTGLMSRPPFVPSVLVILEYLTNMVYCVELILKVLSSDWKSHWVGVMYKTVFGQPHANPALMKEIEDALINQKYLLDPSGGLLAHIGDIEYLYDEVIAKLMSDQNFYWVEKCVPAPQSFLEYLRDNGARFYSKPFPSQERMEGLTNDEREALVHAEYQQDIDKMEAVLEDRLRSGQTIHFYHERIGTMRGY